jgi:cell division protein ZapA (FtsZ GTPase activity inhibitor)
MSSEKTLVRVTIAGEEYTLRAEATPEYTRDCARYVDATIGDIQKQSRSLMEPHKAAILAALSIVDQFFKAQRDLQLLQGQTDVAAARMTAEIEARLSAFDLAAHP